MIVASLMVVAGPAVQASASANVRFVNAVPGSGSVELAVKGGSPIGGTVSFGKVTPYVDLPSGSHEVSLKSGSKTLAVTTVDLSDGSHYTVVAMKQGKKDQLRPYTDGSPTDAKSRLRLIHAAPELGAPDVRLGNQTVAEKVKYTEATPYLTVSPGTYKLSVTKPGSGSGRPIVEKDGVALSAGTSSTAFLIGSAGEPTSVVVSTDQTSGPSRAPRTGLAPLAGGGRPWATIVSIALLAGLLGGAVQLLAARRRTRAR
jgi:hypothetical protein